MDMKKGNQILKEKIINMWLMQPMRLCGTKRTLISVIYESLGTLPFVNNTKPSHMVYIKKSQCACDVLKLS